MIYEWRLGLNHLAGFETENLHGGGRILDFILSNGQRAKQIYNDDPTRFTRIPEDSHKIIRSVNIYHNDYYILSFSFLDKDGVLIWQIGYTDSDSDEEKVETVEIGKNERIFGVVAKMAKGFSCAFSNF
jgi:hypothetical protein